MNGDKKPEGMPYGQWLREKGIGITIKNPVRRELGYGAPSQMVNTDGIPSYVMSEGLLEQEEIDYIGLVAEDREKERRKRPSKMKKELEDIASATVKAPKGERAKLAKELMRR